jgi:simple sugar transport system ATP-binding protein
VHAGAAADASEASLVAAMLGEAAPRAGAASSALVTAAGAETRAAAAPHHDATATPSPHGVVVARAVALRLDDARGRARVRDATFAVHAARSWAWRRWRGADSASCCAPSPGGSRRRRERSSGRPKWRSSPRTATATPCCSTRRSPRTWRLRGAGARRGRVAWGAMARRAAALVAAADVRGGAPAARAGALSGATSRSSSSPASSPATTRTRPPRSSSRRTPRAGSTSAPPPRCTRGCAPRATPGAAVIVHSSDLDEVLALADRVLAVYDGQVIPVAAEREAVGRAMLGG